MKARLIICMMALLVVVGCAPEASDMQAISESVLLVNNKLDAYQAVTTNMFDSLEADGLVGKEILETVDKGNEEIDRIQPQITAMAEAIANTDYVTGDDVGNLFKVAKSATVASASWNQYATPMLLGLSLAEGIVLLLVNRSKNKEAAKKNEEAKKRQADKEGREQTLRELAAMDAAEITAPVVKSMMYNNIGDRRAMT